VDASAISQLCARLRRAGPDVEQCRFGRSGFCLSESHQRRGHQRSATAPARDVANRFAFLSAAKQDRASPDIVFVAVVGMAQEDELPPKYTAEQLRKLWSEYMIEGARYGDEGDVIEALDNNADVNAVDDSGRTALHMAAANGHAAIVQRLLDAGANTEQRNRTGSTALHWACVGGSPDAVKVLLTNGANASALNDAEKSALEHALDSEDILRIFQQHAQRDGSGSCAARDPEALPSERKAGAGAGGGAASGTCRGEGAADSEQARCSHGSASQQLAGTGAVTGGDAHATAAGGQSGADAIRIHWDVDDADAVVRLQWKLKDVNV
jgi:Ankyrin repeats (3 copies)